MQQSYKTKPLLSIAPMMDWTDRHYRYFMRFITKKTLFYTEMVTSSAILKGNREYLLAYSPVELPLALQLGGDNPKDLSEAAKIGEEYGYNEINLNVGCPSEKVVRGSFGACLMAKPELVADCISSMKARTRLPVTVKHRIGINGKETYEDMANFVSTLEKVGCNRFIVHARIAILGGLSPSENRKIPPLRYEDVFQLKRDFPQLTIEINGGIQTLGHAKTFLSKVDGVMIGRAAYENPYQFHQADNLFFDQSKHSPSRLEILEELLPYIENHLKNGGKTHHILRHCLGLFHGEPGAKNYRRHLTEIMYSNNPQDIIQRLKFFKMEYKNNESKLKK